MSAVSTDEKKTLLTPIARRVISVILVLVAAFAIRGLTANFVRAHLDDPGWFPSGIYASFDRQAQDWIDGRSSIFWINDASQTDAAIYPPGYPLWLAFVYEITGSRSPQTVQNVQWVLDALSVLLVLGVGTTAFGWGAGIWSAWIYALWPLPALAGATPLADAPTSWIVITAVWVMLLSLRRESFRWALLAGVLIGVSCWMRANAMLLVFAWITAFLFVSLTWKVCARLSAAILVGAFLIMAPIVVRNAIVFHAFVPTGLGAGTNLWEGLGETERGFTEFGAVPNDQDIIDQERAATNVPPDARFELYYPDGIERDRQRTRKSIAIIVRHPVWYSGTVITRMTWLLRYFGEPSGIYGSAGINVTSAKSLPPDWQGCAAGVIVTGAGMVQSVLRVILLPLMVIGIMFGWRQHRQMTTLMMATVLYYLVVGSAMHTHLRYSLPMQALLVVFAGLACYQFGTLVSRKTVSRSA